MPTHEIVQYGLLLATSVLFAAAFGLGLARMRRMARAMAAAPAGLPHESSMGGPARGAVIAGTCVGLGLLISTFAKTQQQAQLMTMPIMLPSMMLSGFIYSIENMPKVIQAVTYIVPARYFVALVKGIYLRGGQIVETLQYRTEQ